MRKYFAFLGLLLFLGLTACESEVCMVCSTLTAASEAVPGYPNTIESSYCGTKRDMHDKSLELEGTTTASTTVYGYAISVTQITTCK